MRTFFIILGIAISVYVIYWVLQNIEKVYNRQERAGGKLGTIEEQRESRGGVFGGLLDIAI